MNIQYKEKLDGCRASKNMDEVISILQKQSLPICIDDIYTQIKKKNTSVSLSTIYRIVEKLINHNIVRKTTILDNNKALYELVKDEHQHYMICVKCKKMIPIDICPIEEFKKHIAGETGFNITGHKFELYGECETCSPKSTGK